MGKNKDKKKKGKGMEKTLQKTEKKNQKRLKKELDEIGEENIESLIAQFKEKDKELTQVKEEACSNPPSPRTGATLSLHPDKDELMFFGGEYYNGSKTFMYNDLYIYSIKKNQWSLVKAPNPPPPRSSHQAVFLSRNQGELWIFGGEFVSPSESQFYHYNDLWVFRFETKKWEKISAKGAPSPRSGHRMTLFKNKYLVVFGGFHDNLRDCRYHNDTHIFDLETNEWQELKFGTSSEIPSPRSACQLLVSNKNNTVVVYGGYSKEKLKKGAEKGIVHTDMYVLSQETKKDGKVEWQWKKAKHTGAKPSERCSFSMITLLDDTAVLFGGVFDLENQGDDDDDDDDDEEGNVKSVFYNDLYKLDLGTYKWKQLTLKGKKEKVKKPKTKKIVSEDVEEKDNEGESSDENGEDMEVDEETVEETKSELDKLNIKDDSIFAVSINDKPAVAKPVEDDVKITETDSSQALFTPRARRNAYLQVHKGVLYLYGGCYEATGGKEITLTDFYSLNLKKLDEWKTIIEDKTSKDAAAKKSAASDSDDDDDDDDDEDDSDMEIDAPDVEDNEDLKAYYTRTEEFWLNEAKSEFPDEKSKKILAKMGNELCKMFFEMYKKSNNDNNKIDEDDATN